jgi:hypothetical protein
MIVSACRIATMTGVRNCVELRPVKIDPLVFCLRLRKNKAGNTIIDRACTAGKRTPAVWPERIRSTPNGEGAF